MNTKLKILNEAKKLFSENGYKGTSVRKIAAAVGIRESALYNHFTNKEAIFLEIAQEIFSSPFTLDSDKLNDKAKGGKSFLNSFAMQYKLLAFDKENERMFRLLLIELFQNEDLRRKFIEDFHNANIKYLSEGFFIMMQSSLIRSGDPMGMAYEFLSTLFYIRFQVTLMRFDSIDTTGLNTQFERHVDFFWEGIKI